MIPLALRLDPDRPIRDQIYEAGHMGARGVVIEAIGDLAPHRLGATGRRELRHLLQTAELSLVALGLPLRRSLDTTQQLDDRVRRADSAFAMAYELGTRLVLVQSGHVPPSDDDDRHQPGSQLKAFLESLDMVSLAASIDPTRLLHLGIDPALAIRELDGWVAHAYAPGSLSRRSTGSRPARLGVAPVSLDWNAFLGALEEVGYRSFLTLWPDPAADLRAEFARRASHAAQAAGVKAVGVDAPPSSNSSE
jgi:sugar phosphate isomerase/epimerase